MIKIIQQFRGEDMVKMDWKPHLLDGITLIFLLHQIMTLNTHTDFQGPAVYFQRGTPRLCIHKKRNSSSRKKARQKLLIDQFAVRKKTRRLLNLNNRQL